jgi:hypothetical protein
MGYETTLHLVNVKVRPDRLRALKLELRGARRKFGKGSLRIFVENLVSDPEGFLEVEAAGDGSDPYIPAEGEAGIPAMRGKWYEDVKIARWLSKYSGKGEKLILHSAEADGEAWGWEFDGRGKMRPLGFKATGKWQ